VNVFSAFGPKGVSGSAMEGIWAITPLDRGAQDHLFRFA